VREADFKAWFQAQGFSVNTINTQMSKVRKLAKHFGDLDDLHRQGEFDRIEAALKSGDGIPNELGNDGERRHLPTSLRYYRKFLEGTGGSASASLGLTPPDILAAIERCDAAGSVEAFIASHEGVGNPTKF